MKTQNFKDLFSQSSQDYAKYRPQYPDTLYSYLASLCDQKNLAWDCATGSGQAALQLAQHFDAVTATDLSEAQLSQAATHKNIKYQVGSAEAAPLLSNTVNLTTVAQALHWFRHDAFFAEVKRVSAPGGVLAVWCYDLAKIDHNVDEVILNLYRNTLAGCWEPERRFLDAGYKNIQVPFDEIMPPPIAMTATWSLAHLQGYLTTWSAVNTYIKKFGVNPLAALSTDLSRAWGANKTKPVSWDLKLRVFRV